jgi:flagellar protein FliO/FliZ
MDSSPWSYAHPIVDDLSSLAWRGRGSLALNVLGILLAMISARPALADGEPDTSRGGVVAPAQTPIEPGAVGPVPDATERPTPRRIKRTPRLMSTDGWLPGMAGIALALAVVGGLATAARRFAPRPTAGTVQVVGRVSLSPKHSVYMLRVGRRVLLLGAGPQGPPSLITELEDVPESSPAARQEDES